MSEEKIDELIEANVEVLQRTTAVLLCQNNLANFPHSVLSLRNLVDLDISNNQLGNGMAALQDDVFSRLALRRLTLCKNNLTDRFLASIFRTDTRIPMHHTLQVRLNECTRLSCCSLQVKLCVDAKKKCAIWFLITGT